MKAIATGDYSGIERRNLQTQFNACKWVLDLAKELHQQKRGDSATILTDGDWSEAFGVVRLTLSAVLNRVRLGHLSKQELDDYILYTKQHIAQVERSQPKGDIIPVSAMATEIPKEDSE